MPPFLFLPAYVVCQCCQSCWPPEALLSGSAYILRSWHMTACRILWSHVITLLIFSNYSLKMYTSQVYFLGTLGSMTLKALFIMATVIGTIIDKLYVFMGDSLLGRLYRIGRAHFVLSFMGSKSDHHFIITVKYSKLCYIKQYQNANQLH